MHRHQQGQQNYIEGWRKRQLEPGIYMEDDDDTTSGRTTSIQQMLNNDDTTSINIASLLYCDEDPVVVVPVPPPPQQQQSSLVLAATVGDVEEEEHHLRELLMDYMAKERFYAPNCRGSYLEHLMTPQQGRPEATIIPAGRSVSGARSRGVHYIIYAFGRLGLTVATVFNAVNYLDRFLSINCHLWWEVWMVELVSVACLSIACKLDEVNIPSLHHLQMEEVMSHSFLPATVRDMELTLLKALQWRLACVTPYSFLQLLLPLLLNPLPPHTTAPAAAWTTTSHRCTRLLIRSLAEPSFIQFDSSLITSSALRCVALEQDHQTYGHISRLIRLLDKADAAADECFRMMKTLYNASSCCSDESDWNWINTHHHQPYTTSDDEQQLLWSPGVLVIRRPMELQTAVGGGGRLISSSSRRRRRSAVTRRRLFGSSAPQAGSTQLRLQEDDDTTHVRDEDISSHTN